MGGYWMRVSERANLNNTRLQTISSVSLAIKYALTFISVNNHIPFVFLCFMYETIIINGWAKTTIKIIVVVVFFVWLFCKQEKFCFSIMTVSLSVYDLIVAAKFGESRIFLSFFLHIRMCVCVYVRRKIKETQKITKEKIEINSRLCQFG